jgi:exodeoxyribonuclease V alpha subunit
MFVRKDAKPTVTKWAGQIERIFYPRSQDEINTSNFHIAKFASLGGPEFTVVGDLRALPPRHPGEVRGSWEWSDKYGNWQLRTTYAMGKVDNTVNGIQAYLSSGAIPLIGPEMADRLAQHFGSKLYDVLCNHPDRLREVDGIGEARAYNIQEAWLRDEEIRDVLIELAELGIPMKGCRSLYLAHGRDCVKLVQENPFELMQFPLFFGFEQADVVADVLDFPKDSPHRYNGAVAEAVNRWCREGGHTFADIDQATEDAEAILEQADGVAPDLTELFEVSDDIRRYGPVIVRGTAVYLPKYFEAEADIARKVLQPADTYGQPKDVEPVVRAAAEALYDFQLNDTQISAAVMALTSGVSIIAGPPGSGKTTILDVITHVAQLLGLQVGMMAPTGKAARRMTEATGHPAFTVHRYLGYDWASGTFLRNEEDPFDEGMVIVDETSMVDVAMAAAILRAASTGTRVLFVGDPNQLPSIQPGAFLLDCLESDVVPSVVLNTVYRQGPGSDIIAAAADIREGDDPTYGGPDSDFQHFGDTTPEDIAEYVARFAKEEIGYGPEDIQIIGPTYRGQLGIHAINAAMQEYLTAGGRSTSLGMTTYYVGDKVIMTRNCYDLGQDGVMNGETGVVLNVQEGTDPSVTVLFEGHSEEVVIGRTYARDITLAYAISVHRSQGSQFPAVIFACRYDNGRLLINNLVYTGITRAKKVCLVAGEKGAMRKAVLNNAPTERFTMLPTYFEFTSYVPQ